MILRIEIHTLSNSTLLVKTRCYHNLDHSCPNQLVIEILYFVKHGIVFEIFIQNF